MMLINSHQQDGGSMCVDSQWNSYTSDSGMALSMWNQLFVVFTSGPGLHCFIVDVDDHSPLTFDLPAILSFIQL